MHVQKNEQARTLVVPVAPLNNRHNTFYNITFFLIVAI
jgi:hypothetical protein